MNARRTAYENTPGSIDWWLMTTVLVLVCIGLFVVFSASGPMASDRSFGNIFHYVNRQTLFIVIGTVVAFVIAYLPRKFINHLHYPFLLTVILLLTATLWGDSVKGASRWLNFGSFSLQPLEFAKSALALYLAYFFSTKQHNFASFTRGAIPPFMFTLGLCMLLLSQPDYGGAVTLFSIYIALLFVSGAALRYVTVAGVILGIAAITFVINSEYRMRRIFAFLNPYGDRQDSGYQIVQSLSAFGSGGFWGVGLGNGTQKLRYLPEAHTDFILSVLGEELGFLGVSVVMTLFSILFYRCYKIIIGQNVLRDKLSAFGITSVLCFGAIQNISVVLGCVPPKGVALPFISYGGSCLIGSMLCVGFLLNYSRTVRS